MKRQSISSNNSAAGARASGYGLINAPQGVPRDLVLLHKCETVAEAIMSELRSDGCDTFLTKPDLVKLIYDEVSEDVLPQVGQVNESRH